LQFRLRTLLLVTTATAVYLGVNTGLNRLLNNSPVAFGGQLLWRAAFKLPLFLVWLIAAIWVYERRRRLRGSGLVMWALGLMIAWNTVSDQLNLVLISHLNQGSRPLASIFLMALSVISIAVTAAGWALILVAYARSNDRWVGVDAVDQETEEMSGPLTLLRE
jgi:hypothetical protein